MDLEQKLGSVLEAHPEVICGYLFGSRARGKARPGSDVDVAVLVTRAELLVTLEAELTAACHAQPVDLLNLATAPPLLAFQVVAEGKLLCERDRRRRVEFVARTFSRYQDYHPVYQRFLQRCRERRERARNG